MGLQKTRESGLAVILRARLARDTRRPTGAELEIVSLDIERSSRSEMVADPGSSFTSPRPICSRWRSKGSTTWLTHPREMLIETSKRGVVGVEIIADDDVRRTSGCSSRCLCHRRSARANPSQDLTQPASAAAEQRRIHMRIRTSRLGSPQRCLRGSVLPHSKPSRSPTTAARRSS